MHLLVRPSEQKIEFASGENLLQLLLKQGLAISHSCLAGRCGTCRCTLTRGVGEQAVEEAILACQTTLVEDCAVDIPEVDEIVIHPARVIKATVVDVQAATHDIRVIRLRPNKPLSFSPGQYASLQFGPDLVRPYSMAGVEGDEFLEFHIRTVPGGLVSNYVAQTVKVGDSVRVSGPLGTSYLRRKYEGPIVCVAGGTGLAPILSILKAAVEERMQNPIHVYFGVRSSSDVYGLNELKRLQRESTGEMKLSVVVAEGDPGADFRRGMLADAVNNDLKDCSDWRGYLCGSPGMVESVKVALMGRGMLEKHIYADAFFFAPVKEEASTE